MMKSCIAQWKMNDDAANTTVLDSVGGYNGTAQQNTEDINAVGQINGSLRFNGTIDYISTTFDPNHFKNTFSLNFWVYINSGAYNYILRLYGTSNDYVELISNTESMDLIFSYKIGSETAGPFDVHPPEYEKWTMVTFVVENLGATIKATGYLNGIEDGVFSTTTASMPNFDASGGTLLLGAQTPECYFSLYGSLDNVMIFNKALSQAEIDCLYNGGDGIE
jgi:hypothetical protein